MTYNNDFYTTYCPNLVAKAAAAGYVAEDDASDVDTVDYVTSELIDAFEDFLGVRWDWVKRDELVQALAESDGDFDKAERYLDMAPVYDPYEGAEMFGAPR